MSFFTTLSYLQTLITRAPGHFRSSPWSYSIDFFSLHLFEGCESDLFCWTFGTPVFTFEKIWNVQIFLDFFWKNTSLLSTYVGFINIEILTRKRLVAWMPTLQNKSQTSSPSAIANPYAHSKNPEELPNAFHGTTFRHLGPIGDTNSNIF